MSLVQVLTDTLAKLGALLATRMELFGLEADELRARVVRRLIILLAASLCLFMALLLASFTLALYFWPTPYRFLALVLMLVFYAALGAGLAIWLLLDMRKGPAAFALTTQVLHADAQALAQLRPTKMSAHTDAGTTGHAGQQAATTGTSS